MSTYSSHTRVLKSRKAQTHTQTQSKRRKPVKLGLVRMVTAGMGFVVMPMHNPGRSPSIRWGSPCYQKNLLKDNLQKSIGGSKDYILTRSKKGIVNSHKV